MSRYGLGLAVLRAMGLEREEAEASVVAAVQRDVEAGAPRPRDVSLSAAKARALLDTELLGPRAGLARALS